MKRIVVGVDGSPGSHAALSWAVEEARLRGATVVCVTAWEAPMVYGSGLAPVPEVLPDDAYEEAATEVMGSEVSKVLAGASADVPLERVTVEGPPGEALLQASADADLLVVGSRGHGTIVGMLLGSVSQHCVHHAKCPVVVVPHA